MVISNLKEYEDSIADLNLGLKGETLAPKNDKVLLVDADTILFAACSACEYEIECLPAILMSPEQYKDLKDTPTYDPATNTIREVSIHEVDAHITDKLDRMLAMTGCDTYELHLTGGRKESFRYGLFDMYKANRRGSKTPARLHETKERWAKKDNVFIHTKWEADDMVVALRRDNPDKYILAAVDKDVLFSLPGKHFNYYESIKHDKEMKWIEVSKEQATKHHYLQALTGDSSDNIKGLPNIGPKRAAKILEGLESSVDMWNAVVDAYVHSGFTVIDALITMRLVSMHQLIRDKEGHYKLELWKPPVGVSDGTD